MAKILSTDTFTRANQSGLGTASDGETWSTASGSATQSIVSNEGHVTACTALTFLQLGTSTSATGEGLVRVKMSDANINVAGICLRATGTTTFYRARFNTATSSQGIGITKTIAGTSTTLFSASFTITTGSFYWLRFKVIGNTLMARGWLDGNAEPTTWNVSGTDTSIAATSTGTYGLCTSSSVGTSTWDFDNFTVTDGLSTDDASSRLRLANSSTKNIAARSRIASQSFKDILARFQVATSTFLRKDLLTRLALATITSRSFSSRLQFLLQGMLASDTFTRSNQSGFGTASDGETWTTTGSGTLSLTSNRGVITSIGSDTHVQLGTKTSATQEVVCRITANDFNDICGIEGRYSVSGGNTTSYKLLWYTNAIHINRAVSGVNTQLTSVSFTMTPGVAYWMKLRCSGSTLYGRIWQSGSAEPTTWTTTTTDTTTASGGFAVIANSQPTSTGIQFDNFVAYDGLSRQDILGRLVLAFPTQLKNTTSRTRIASQSLKDLLARFRLSILKQKEVPTRLSLSILAALSLTNRMQLQAIVLKNVVLRLAQMASQIKGIGSRFRLLAQIQHDTSFRFLFSQIQVKTLSARALLSIQKQVTLITRLPLLALKQNSFATRVSMSARSVVTTAMRSRLLSQQLVYLGIRAILFGQSISSLSARSRLQAILFRSFALRLMQQAQRLFALPSRLLLASQIAHTLSARVSSRAFFIRDITSRVRLSQTLFPSLLARVLLQSQRLQTVPARLLLRLLGAPKDTLVRTRIASLQQTFLTTRFLLGSLLQLRVVPFRLSLASLRLKDLSTHIVHAAQQVQSTVLRFSLSSLKTSILFSRFRLSSQHIANTTIRTRLLSQSLVYLGIRAILFGQRLSFLPLRVQLASQSLFKNLGVRLVASALHARDDTGRLRLSQLHLQTLSSRMRQQVLSLQDMLLRIRLATITLPSLVSRTRLSSPITLSSLLTRILLQGKQIPSLPARLLFTVPGKSVSVIQRFLLLSSSLFSLPTRLRLAVLKANQIIVARIPLLATQRSSLPLRFLLRLPTSLLSSLLTRIRIAALIQKGVTSRLPLQATLWENLFARFSLQGNRTQAASTRLQFASLPFWIILPTRLLIAGLQLPVVTIRLIQQAVQTPNVFFRLRFVLPGQTFVLSCSTRFQLQSGPGVQQVHFRLVLSPFFHEDMIFIPGNRSTRWSWPTPGVQLS